MPQAALLPDMLDSAKSKDVQIAMLKDLRVAAKTLRGKPVFFVTAANVPLGDKTKVSLFLALKLEQEAKAWELKLKARKPQAMASGTCKLDTKDGVAVQVALQKVKGDRTAALKAANLAFKLEKKVNVADPLAKGGPGGQSESGSQEHEAEEAKKELDQIGRGIGAMVDKAPVDNAETLEILKQFQDLGLDEAQIKAALKATFG
jgi:hypothetical protein